MQPEPPVEPTSTKTSALAAWSLASAIASFFCLWGIGGVLGIGLGVMARAEIDAAERRLSGKGLALTGILLGALNLLLVAGALGALIVLSSRPAWPTAAAATPAPAPTRRPAPTPAPRPPSARPPRLEQHPAQTRDDGLVVTRVGKIDVVDFGPDSGPLAEQLVSQEKIAHGEGKKLLIVTVQGDCKPCNGLAVALADERMQRALSHVRIVRIDFADFPVELRHLSIPIARIPGFSLIADGRLVDYVDGGEWDDDIAANIAPVLDRFVHGRYTTRRRPWHGVERDDETAL